MRTPGLTPIVRALMAINIIVFGVEYFGHKEMIVSVMGLHYFTSEKFLPFQFLTSIFVHADLRHLFNNMLGLFFLGPMLEMYWGEKRFLTFFLITGMGSGLLYMGLKYYDYSTLEAATRAYIEHPDLNQFSKFLYQYFPDGIPHNAYVLIEGNPNNITVQNSVLIAQECLRSVLDTPLIGASGAVFGVMAGFALLFPNTELMLFLLPIPIKAKYFVALYGLYELYAGLNKMPGDNVAHFAHIGGMVFAFILIKIWGKNRNSFY
ncbi:MULTISPECIES: rhomboid family intramembrane serine protease [unclassified Arcicella]|uniref:rhomboid family intramembrane serine protease n=1 Tax=unclassified Arcicella TaxID=2644986 RepID=UPI0028630552|nr:MULTISPECIES: rhomboid family intramembrane serine protease [unclassified Arcicella]MDR6563853.1 membrane associated rhomboid family serine protease [Arcicella sp. BE51]MDR6813606.1 membrane associated rhomboid family serine protease [Arcicella sp. BE140]MDR6825013.1 membrane associated rhomboid family serine protease [Arcicella sp. BE139]